MHPCLCVDEIIRRIAHELVTSGGRATSVALACCGKTLEDPILDVLWETQGSLLPLLKSLAGDVWNEGECTVSPPTIYALSLLNCLIWKSFQRLPTTMEWARFMKYAQSMRSLYVQCGQYSEVLSVLQLCAVDKPLFPNLEYISLGYPTRDFIPSTPLFLSPRTTTISVTFNTPSTLPKAMVASMITTFPTLCPNLQGLYLNSLPRDPMITAGVSKMILASNRNTLQRLTVDSPLTEAAYGMIFKLPNLRNLLVVIEGDILLPSVTLPNLTNITIKYHHDRYCLQLFRGATFGKLASVTFHSESESIGNFLEEFESLALTISISDTLSSFAFYTLRSWRPNYRSLLSFTHLTGLMINSSCQGGCSSTVDDDIIIDIARAMPGLGNLQLGNPCQTPTGITAKGLAALAHYCPHLSTLCIHFQVASLDLPAIPGDAYSGEPTTPREDCALTCLNVGRMPLPEESVLVVALTLLHIFPRIIYLGYSGEGWRKVADAITRSKQLVHRSSKKRSLAPPWSKFDDTSLRGHFRECYVIKKCSGVLDRSNFTPTTIPLRILPVPPTLHRPRAAPLV